MKRRLASFFTILALSPSLGFSQNPQESAAESAPEAASVDDLSVVYKADYFDQFQPVSVNDMVSRIPGIGLALGGGGGGGSRGLGGGAGQRHGAEGLTAGVALVLHDAAALDLQG